MVDFCFQSIVYSLIFFFKPMCLYYFEKIIFLIFINEGAVDIINPLGR